MKLTVRIDEQTFEVDIPDLNARPVVAIVDGQAFEVWPEQAAQQWPHAAAQPALSNGSAATARPVVQPRSAPSPTVSGDGTVRAPIPGVIQAIDVKPGDAVEAGQQLCVLEAMKMKNLIRAARAGIIAAVHVTVGQQVRHHEPLVSYHE